MSAITTTAFGVHQSEDCKSGIDMLAACGGSFDIEKVQVSYPWEDKQGVPSGMDSEGNPFYAPKWNAVACHVPVRSDTGEAVADKTVGDDYTVLQNREVIDIVDAICGDHDLNYDFMTTIHGGRGLAVQVKCPDLTDALSIGNDVVEGRLTITNFHDGTGSLKVFISLLRMMCANKLPAIGREYRKAKKAGKLGTYAIKHSKNMEDRIRDMVMCYKQSMGDMVSTSELLLSMANKRITAAARQAFFTALVNADGKDEGELTKRAKTMRQNKMESLQSASRMSVNKVEDHQGSWYEALQAATYFGTHEIMVRNTGRAGESENRYVSKNFGAGADFNKLALMTALEMSEVA